MTNQRPADEFGFRGAAVSSAKCAIEHLEIPEGANSFLIGSCAEGFGDPMSDIDIVIAIPPGTNKEAVFRHYTWVGDQRVEIYSRPIDKLKQFVSQINNMTPETVVSSFKRGRASEDVIEEDLGMYHKILFAYPIEENTLLLDVHDAMNHEKLIDLRASLEQVRFINYMELALAAEKFEAANLATSYARRALVAAATGWCARQGQTYPSKKFLGWKLLRGGLSVEKVAEFEDLLSSNGEDFLHNSASFADFIDIFNMPVVDRPAKFTLDEEVFQVRLINQLWIGDQKRTIVLPSPTIGAFDASIGSGIAQTPESPGVRCLCFLAGMARLETSAGRTERVSQAVDSKSEAILTAMGFARLSSEPIVVDDGLRTLVDAALAICMAGIRFANRKEDAIGAAKSARWRQFEVALGHMRDCALDAISYSETFRPAPVERACRAVFRASSAVELLDQAQRAAAVRSRDAATAEQALNEADVIFSRLAPEVFGELYNAMASARGGIVYLEHGIVWGKVAKSMGKTLSLTEISEREWEAILEQFDSFNLAQEMRVHIKPEMFQFGWSRSDDLRAAVINAPPSENVV